MATPFKGYIGMRQGFTEDEGANTGVRGIWRFLRGFSGPDVWVSSPREWNSDWKEIARSVAAETNDDSIIIEVAYSWGAGDGFVRLCREYEKVGRRVTHAILIDPVHRLRYTPRWPQWLAGVSNPLSLVGFTERGRKFRPIEVSNVGEVDYFRQAQTVPAGRAVVAKDPSKTLVHEPTWLERSHVKIDEDDAVIRKVVSVVQRYFPDAKP